MAVFLLTPDDMARLSEAKRLALENPAALEVVARMAGAATQDAKGVVRGGRPNDAPVPARGRLGG